MTDKTPLVNIDFAFISKLEGSSNRGYVPDPTESQSGVTIASGFDIGQRQEAELKNAFDNELCAKLLPYVNKIQQKAVAELQAIPLELSDAEVEKINCYSHSQAEERLVTSWDESNTYASFESLSVECQTVVASVSFQYGSLKLKTPNFWKQVTTGAWQSALQNLRNFGDKYPSRRNKEADLLEQWLTNTSNP